NLLCGRMTRMGRGCCKEVTPPGVQGARSPCLRGYDQLTEPRISKGVRASLPHSGYPIMGKTTALIEPRLPRGFVDSGPEEIAAVEEMVGKIKAVYERYGFDPVQTPFFEYTEALG